MRKIIFFIIFIIFLAIFIGFKVQSNQPKIALIEPTPASEPDISAEKLMSVVNDWRYTQGFQPYTKNDLLCSIASRRLPQIEKDWSHNGFQEVHDKYLPRSYMAENLAKGSNSEEATLNAWLHSPEHRKNLDADYRYSCIKCDKNYCVEIFANYE